MTERLSGTADEPEVRPRDGDAAVDEAAARDEGVAADEAAGADQAAVADDAPAVRGLERRRGSVARTLGNPRVAWAVAILALVLALLAGTQWADLYAAERAREEVRADATELVLQLTTFDGADIETWVREAQEHATGDYAEQLTTLFDQNLRDALRENEVVSRGEVTQLFVQSLEGDEARVFALVRQTITNASTTDPVQDELRMDITMRKEGDRWLASDVAVLGPSGVVSPAPGDQPEGEQSDQEGDQ